MSDQSRLVKRLCECLAFHTVETENTSKFMRPVPADVTAKIAEAKELIAEAGYSIDEVYPAADRPVVGSTAKASNTAH